MKTLKYFLRIAGIVAAATIGGNQQVAASNPGFTLHQICPVGGFEYEVRVGPSGTPLPQPTVTLPRFVDRLANRRRCPGNNFPRYRAFTLDERVKLDALVQTPAYLERAELPYGALSIWIEEQLTGSVPPRWAGPHIFIDELFEGSRDLRKAAIAALPKLIEGANISRKNGFDRATELADIAYLLRVAGRRDEARDWNELSWQYLQTAPEEKRPFAGATAREVVETASVCVQSPLDRGLDLCQRDGAFGIARYVFFCALTSSKPDCDRRDGWPVDPELLVRAAQDERETNATFKKLFDRSLEHVLYGFGHLGDNHCINRKLLGIECPVVYRRTQTSARASYFSDLISKFDRYNPADHPGSLAHLLFHCKKREQAVCRGADTATAIAKGRSLFPEFAEAYDKLQNERIVAMAARHGKCVSTNLLLGEGSCELDPAFSEHSVLNAPDYISSFEASKQETLNGYVTSLASCKLSSKLSDEPGFHCDKLSASLSFEAAAEKLRSIVPDYDRLYDEAWKSGLVSYAKRIGRAAASAEVRPSYGIFETHRKQQIDDRAMIAQKLRLIALFPEADQMIEQFRIESLTGFTTPR